MKQQQRGFTLIELVMVIVILGILAAVAIPKFIDLRQDAADGTVKGVAGALSSASAINYAVRGTGKGVAVADCNAAAGLIQGGSLPTGYTLTNATTTTTVGSPVDCGLTGTVGSTVASATFTAIITN